MTVVILFVGLCIAACLARVEAVLKGVLWGAGVLLLIGACAGIARADDCAGYRTSIGQDLCRMHAERARVRAAADVARVERAEEARRHEEESRIGSDAVNAVASGAWLPPRGGLGETNVSAGGPSNPELDELRRQAGVR